MLNDFTLVLVSLLIETLPFVILASLISGFMELLLPSGFFSKIKSNNPYASLLVGSSVGFLVPMCECGSVVIARRLMKKGMAPAGALAYMLAGPIVSPITIMSTYTAYYYMPKMALYRVLLGIFIASLTALLIYQVTKGRVLKEQKSLFDLQVVGTAKPSLMRKVEHALKHAADDFMSIYPLLLLGITLTSIFKVLLPTNVLVMLNSHPFVDVFFAPMLAVSLSLCAEADAFIASALNNILSMQAQLAFLVIGPMLDIKLFLIYKRVFNTKTLSLLVTFPLLSTLIIIYLWKVLI